MGSLIAALPFRKGPFTGLGTDLGLFCRGGSLSLLALPWMVLVELCLFIETGFLTPEVFAGLAFGPTLMAGDCLES